VSAAGGAEVCVVGPGALGCLYAALLQRGGVPTVLLDHRPDRASLIAGRGIVLEEDDAATTIPVPCAATPADLPPVALLLLCVKTFGTRSALEHATPLLAAHGDQSTAPLLVRLQNGLGELRDLTDFVPLERLVLGTSGHGANLVAPGHVRHAGSGPTFLGAPPGGSHEAAAAAAALLGRAVAEVSAVADTQSMLWRKLLVNAAINPLGALTGLPNGQLLEVPLLAAALRDLAREVAMAASAQGADLGTDWPEGVVREVCERTAQNLCSMLQDVRTGRPTEVAAINGAVAQAGVPAPLNAVLAWLVSEVLSGAAANAPGRNGHPSEEESAHHDPHR